MSKQREDAINTLVKLLKENQNVLLGITNQTGIGSIISVKTELGYIDAKSINVIAPGKVFIVKTSTGWEAYAEVTNTLINTTVYVNRRQLPYTPEIKVTSPFKGLFRDNTFTKKYIGLDRKPIKNVTSLVGNYDYRYIVNTGKGKKDWYLVEKTQKGIRCLYPDGTSTYNEINDPAYSFSLQFMYPNLGYYWVVEPNTVPPFSNDNGYSIQNYILKSYTINNINTYIEEINSNFKNGSIPEQYVYTSDTDYTYSSTPIDLEIKKDGKLPLPDGSTLTYLTLNKNLHTYEGSYIQDPGTYAKSAEILCYLPNYATGDGTYPYSSDINSTFGNSETEGYTKTTKTELKTGNIWFYSDQDNFGYSVTTEQTLVEDIYSKVVTRNGSDSYTSNCVPEENVYIHYEGVRTENYLETQSLTKTTIPRTTTNYIKWKSNYILLKQGLDQFTFFAPVNASWKITPEANTFFNVSLNYANPLDYLTTRQHTKDVQGNKTLTETFDYSVIADVQGDFRPGYDSSPHITTENNNYAKQPNPFWSNFPGREVDMFLYISPDTTYWYTGHISAQTYVDTELSGYLPIPNSNNPKSRRVTSLTLTVTGFKKINTGQLNYTLGNPNFLIIQAKTSNNVSTFSYSATTVANDKIYVSNGVNQEAKKGLVFVYEVIGDYIKMVDIKEERVIPVKYTTASLVYDSYYPKQP